MSFIPCVTLANLTTPVTNVGGGGGGGGTYPANATFSSITTQQPGGVAGITLIEGATNFNSIYFNSDVDTAYQFRTFPAANPDKRVLEVLANTAGTATGELRMTTVNQLTAPDANLSISTINGVVPGGGGGGGAVDSVASTAFNSILASPNTGAVQLALGAVKAAFPVTTLGTVNLANTNLTDIVELGGQFNLASFAPGWYGICIPQISVCVGQNPVGTPNLSAVYAGASIQYQIVCGASGGQQSTSPIHNYVLVPYTNNVLYTQTTPTTMVGIFYQPVATGLCNTLKLKAFYNPPDASGITAFGTVAHASPSLSPGTNITILPLVAA